MPVIAERGDKWREYIKKVNFHLLSKWKSVRTSQTTLTIVYECEPLEEYLCNKIVWNTHGNQGAAQYNPLIQSDKLT